MDESSEEELTMRGIRRKMTKKQREGCNQTVTGRLQQVGATYPLEDLDTTYSSGTDFSDVDRKVRSSGRKVKSGAKVKIRPVERTELWPHTIACEEDGEDITSIDISL